MQDPAWAEWIPEPWLTIFYFQGEDCDGLAAAASALLESVGIPTRLHGVGYAPGDISHVFAEAFDPLHGWMVIDPTLEVRVGQTAPYLTDVFVDVREGKIVPSSSMESQRPNAYQLGFFRGAAAAFVGRGTIGITDTGTEPRGTAPAPDQILPPRMTPEEAAAAEYVGVYIDARTGQRITRLASIDIYGDVENVPPGPYEPPAQPSSGGGLGMLLLLAAAGGVAYAATR